MSPTTENQIRQAIGSHAVFLAARHDPQLVGRFKKSRAGTLFVDGEKANKPKLASVLIYLTGKWGMRPSEFELYTGILGAADTLEASQEKQEPEVHIKELNFVAVGLQHNHVGLTTTELIHNFPGGFSLQMRGRAGEMAMSRILKKLGWERRRNMIHGMRAYRWYPTDDWEFADSSEPQRTDLQEEVDVVWEDKEVPPHLEVIESDIFEHPIVGDDDDAMVYGTKRSAQYIDEDGAELDPWGDPINTEE